MQAVICTCALRRRDFSLLHFLSLTYPHVAMYCLLKRIDSMATEPYAQLMDISVDDIDNHGKRQTACNFLFTLSSNYGYTMVMVFTACRNALIASAVLATAIPSVRPSVCPSHAGIVSKRRHVARCSLHCRIAKCV